MFPFILDLLNLLNFNFILISENKEVSVREDIQLFELGHDSHLWDYKVSHDPVKDCERQRQLQERLMIFPQAHWENVTSSCESVWAFIYKGGGMQCKANIKYYESKILTPIILLLLYKPL